MYLRAVPDGCLNILARNFSWPCGCWPQSWPAPKPLKKSTRFRDVKQSHAHSQTFLSQAVPFVSLSTYKAHAAFVSASFETSSLCSSAWRWKTVRVKCEFKPTKCPSVYAEASKGKRTSAPIHIDLFSPGDSCATKICSFGVCMRGRRCCHPTLWTLRWVVEVQPTAFPQGRDVAGQWECLSASSLSLTSKSVNL